MCLLGGYSLGLICANRNRQLSAASMIKRNM